jgi:hypothetical protein
MEALESEDIYREKKTEVKGHNLATSEYLLLQAFSCCMTGDIN